MTHDEMVQAIQDTADAIGGDVREDYSGRGMYGSQCYGIVCDDATECIEEAAERGLKGASRDSMGKRSIVYWTRVKSEQAA